MTNGEGVKGLNAMMIVSAGFHLDVRFRRSPLVYLKRFIYSFFSIYKSRDIYYAKYYGKGGGRNGKLGKKIGVREKNEKRGKKGGKLHKKRGKRP